MSEVKRRRGRPRKEEWRVDEVATQEAIVAFYEKRLEEALEKLGMMLQNGHHA